MEIIAWIGFSQSLFAAILLIAKRNASDPDKILAAWLSLLAIEFLTCAIDYNVLGYPILSSSFLLFNPAFYIYIRSLVDKNFKPKWIQLMHLLPFIVFEIGAYLQEETISLQTFFEFDTTFPFRMLFGLANVLSWWGYNLYSIWLIIKHRRNLKNEFSTLEGTKTLGWILLVAIFYILYCTAAFIMGATVIIVGDNPLLPHIYNYSALLGLIYIFSFYGLKQEPIFKKPLIQEKGGRYKKSVLSVKKKNDIKTLLLNYFEKEKPYLNSDLNMDLLSETLKIPKHNITEVLNTEIGNNFFQFVNNYRVNEVKKMLDDKKNLFSIEAIGYECGFNSKSSFFTVFKNITGMTPLQYKSIIK
ncbi:MAG: AraC family transcriptional regulator [Bacteroidales bacterium]|nr:AraC family transcriptional regulator [Bacteroidales bacterium]